MAKTGLGIPVEVTANIFGEDITFIITPPTRKVQKEIEKQAEEIDKKDTKECAKKRKELERVEEELKTYDLENATAEERSEYRSLLKKKNKLIDKITDDCPDRCDDKNKLFEKMVRSMIVGENRDHVADMIIEKTEPTTGYYWLLQIYADELGKQSEEQ